jgi:hypothetical protein
MSDIFQQLESNNKEEVEAVKQKILEQFISGNNTINVLVVMIVETNVFSTGFMACQWTI